MRCPIIIILLIVALSLNAGIDPKTEVALSEFIEKQAKQDGLKDVAVAVVDLDGVVFRKYMGASVGPDSSFVIGSLSKAITAVAVIQLVEQQKLDLDSPVNRYLEGFNPAGIEGVVTIRHLLNQRSGFIRRQGFEAPGDSGAVRAKLQFTPGDRYSYSNLNYALLGNIVETATQASFSEYVRKNIFEPLGMRNASAESVFLPGENGLKGNRFLYWSSLPIDEPIPRKGGVPSGFIRASANDMALFLSEHLKSDSSKLRLSKEAMQLLHTPATGNSGYTMGWYATKSHGTLLLRHSGLSSSFSSSMALLPDRSLGVIVLTNINSFTGSDHLRNGIIDILSGDSAAIASPQERWIRFGAFAILIISSFQLLLAVARWRKSGMPMHLRISLKVLFPVLVSIFIAAALLVIVPALAKTPLVILATSQIDLGAALILGLLFGIVRSILKGFIKQQKS